MQRFDQRRLISHECQSGLIFSNFALFLCRFFAQTAMIFWNYFSIIVLGTNWISLALIHVKLRLFTLNRNE